MRWWSPRRVRRRTWPARRCSWSTTTSTNRRILIAQLRQWGMAVRATGSPQEAIEWVRGGSRFDVALLDYLMPDIDGVALAKALAEITDPSAVAGHRGLIDGRARARAGREQRGRMAAPSRSSHPRCSMPCTAF